MPRLSSIADIRMGATLRGRDATRPDPNGSYQFVRIGDISQDGTLRTDDFLRIEPNDPVKEDLWLRPGDVLFPNRGTRTTALAFPLDQPRTIVGPQFFIVRPDNERVSAEYLAWFLRSAEAAAHFEARRKGTYVQIIQRATWRKWKYHCRHLSFRKNSWRSPRWRSPSESCQRASSRSNGDTPTNSLSASPGTQVNEKAGPRRPITNNLILTQ